MGVGHSDIRRGGRRRRVFSKNSVALAFCAPAHSARPRPAGLDLRPLWPVMLLLTPIPATPDTVFERVVSQRGHLSAAARGGLRVEPASPPGVPGAWPVRSPPRGPPCPAPHGPCSLTLAAGRS